MTRVAIIGAGFGGLALGIRLQSAGIETTIVEARDKPGGRAYVWHDQGFTFDAGPTVITDPACLEELFALSGRKLADYVELMPVSPFYRLLWEDGTRFDYVNDQAELDRQIAALNPGDVEGYRKFLKFSEAVYAEGYKRLGTVPFLKVGQMLAAAPALVGLQAWRSVYDTVAGYVKDDHLRQALSFHTLLVGGSPFAASSIYALIHALERDGGVWFPKGGTHALVRGLAKLFEDLGGKLIVGDAARRIVTENGKVTGIVHADGRAESFDAVASNADIVHTYDKNALADDFSLYLHSPSVSDPDLAPPGCSAHYVLSPVPHLGVADIDWEIEGPRYRDRILDYLDAHVIPGLKDSLVTTRIFTPKDFERELNAWQGSAFSLEPVLTQSAWFRTHNRDDVIGNLYFVGAGTHPGAGVPGVVGSAKATAGLMIEDLRG